MKRELQSAKHQLEQLGDDDGDDGKVRVDRDTARRAGVAFAAVDAPHENPGDVAEVFVYGSDERIDHGLE